MDCDQGNNFKKGKKILHLAPGQWAGHTRIYQRECRTLINSGYDVSLVAHALPIDNIDSRIDFLELGELPKPNYNWKIINRINRCSKTYKIANSIKADLIHFHSPEFLPWAVRLRKAKRIPIIFDCMEDFESYVFLREGIPEIFRSIIARIVANSLEFGIRNSDAVIFADKGTSVKFKNTAKRIEIIHNFPDLTIFNPFLENSIRKKYDIVYNGAVSQPNLIICFSIDEELRKRGYKLKWLFFGRNPEGDWIKDQLVLRNLTDRFTFEGLIPQEQVPNKILQAKIGLIPLPDIPKYRNNIPQKLFEFMSLGIPAVLSDLPPSRNLIGEKDCSFLIKADDYSLYAEAIINLLNNEDLYQDMAMKAKTLIIEEFNWQRESRKLINLYEEFI